MKTPFLALFFFLLAFAAAADPVLDTDGKPVINNGSQYYMLPAIRGTGGGFILTRTENEKCPLTVVQASSELSNGLSVRISSRQGEETISTGWIVNIQFVKVPTCTPKPSVWYIPPDSYSMKIRTDKRLSSDLMIEKASEENGYKVLHCPSHPRSCKEIGIVTDEERNRLLKRGAENPLIVRFKKATENSEN